MKFKIIMIYYTTIQIKNQLKIPILIFYIYVSWHFKILFKCFSYNVIFHTISKIQFIYISSSLKLVPFITYLPLSLLKNGFIIVPAPNAPNIPVIHSFLLTLFSLTLYKVLLYLNFLDKSSLPVIAFATSNNILFTLSKPLTFWFNNSDEANFSNSSIFILLSSNHFLL